MTFVCCIVLMIDCRKCGQVRVLLPLSEDPSKRFRCPICRGRTFLTPAVMGRGQTINKMPYWEQLGKTAQTRTQELAKGAASNVG